MTEPEDKRKVQAFEAIGSFIFRFSQLEFTVKALLANLLELSDEHFDVVTAPYDFAILCTVTKTILIQKFPAHQKKFEKVFNECRALNDARVRIAHALWQDDGKNLTARYAPRSSLKAKYFFDNIDDLTKVAAKAQSLMEEMLFIVPQTQESPPSGARIL